MELPSGKWKHLHKSWEWEAYNRNPAKGMVGEFTYERPYLRWQSEDGQESFFIDVKDMLVGSKLLIIHRSGLQYWFERVEESNGTEKRKKNTTTRSLGRGNPSHSNGQRGPKSPS